MPVQVTAQPTPNPNAVKFTVSQMVSPGGSKSFNSRADAASHPLAASLFEIPGVLSVFFLNDFITVTREPGADWEAIVPAAEAAIRAHFELQA
jgi:hypothetical protein